MDMLAHIPYFERLNIGCGACNAQSTCTDSCLVGLFVYGQFCVKVITPLEHLIPTVHDGHLHFVGMTSGEEALHFDGCILGEQSRRWQV